jgi:NlpC/P60 family
MKLVSLMIAFAGMFFYQPKTYTDALRSHVGEKYAETTCSALICKAHEGFSDVEAHCSAREFWEGCDGNLTRVAVAEGLAKIDWSKVQAGDVLAMNGVHVIAYLGNGQCIDSDPLHDGVREVSVTDLIAKKNDAWFTGPVRVERWVK